MHFIYWILQKLFAAFAILIFALLQLYEQNPYNPSKNISDVRSTCYGISMRDLWQKQEQQHRQAFIYVCVCVWTVLYIYLYTFSSATCQLLRLWQRPLGHVLANVVGVLFLLSWFIVKTTQVLGN